MSSLDNERYSLCIVHVDNGGEKPFYRFFRVADFIPEDDPNELVPALVEQHASSLEEAWDNPDHLYNPSAAYSHESRESDFYLFQWRQDLVNLGKQLTRSVYDDPSLSSFKEAREVIILNGDGGEQSLRSALSDGIPFTGKTTSVFYIAYGSENGLRPAIRCERRDFSFEDGKIKLRYDLANARKTVLAAPRVWLKHYDIIESPHAPTSYRKIYAKLGELESDGTVLLRSLDYYASDYVKWFTREESIPISKTNRRAVAQIIDVALARTDALEVYLEAGAPEEEVESLRKAIARIVMEGDDQERELFRRALLEDESFHRECIEEAMRLSDTIIEERKNDLAKVENDVERAKGTLQALRSDIDSLHKEKRLAETDIADITADLECIRKEQDKVLEELQSNIALRLGLKSVAPQPQTYLASNLVTKEGVFHKCDEVDSDFKGILLNNMKRLGLTSIFGSPDEERRRLAVGIMGGMTATRFMAIPQPVARQVADSVSIALSGRSAKRVFVPADFRDLPSVLNGASSEDRVVLVEGVIDSVNESVLFSLLSESLGPIVVFSFASHASAALVAKETWGRVFLPNAGSLQAFSASMNIAKLQRAVSPLELLRVTADDALEGARDLGSELEPLCLTAEQLLLSATVLRAVEELADEDSIEHFISQHLLMSSPCDNEAFTTLGEWSDNDKGLAELARRLGVYGS
ncbi:hypothetical protein [Adlercreutzia muris]|uniref:hypothetical protein n=1 Tax=Adlercreutzia muris TaxID=1796610 RepID=UPI001F59AF40|nr:hypothetical protein [Adlercreutzia muris]